MKILHEGVIPEERQYRGSCNRCKTIAEFGVADGKVEKRDGFDTVVIGCPVCKGEITRAVNLWMIDISVGNIG